MRFSNRKRDTTKLQDNVAFFFLPFYSGYVIEKRDLTHGGGWVPAVTHVNPKYNHATVPRLLEGTTYEFRVSAENLQGRSEPLTTDHSVVAKNQFGKFRIYCRIKIMYV